MDSLLIRKAIETAPSGFAVQGNLLRLGEIAGQVSGMLAKGALDRLDREPLERVTNRGVSRRALPIQSTQRIEPFPARVDETLDLPVGRGARQNG